MKLLNHFFTCAGLVGVMETGIGTVSSEVYGFELSSCQLQISLGEKKLFSCRS
jgi:hypothetical protein